MKLKLSGLVILAFLLTTVSASGGQMFGPVVENDTTHYYSIQDYFLSPFQLTDYNYVGGGARARGMGGAFFAVSDDPTAASWNPAGLTQLDKAQMNLSFSSYMGRREYTSTLNSDSWNYSFGDEQKHDVNSVSFASVVIPFTMRDRELVGGVLYQRLADIYQENNYALILDEVIFEGPDTVENYLLPPIDEKVQGKLDAATISLATKLFKSLSLGLGVNIYTGKFTSDVNFFYTFDDGINGLRFYPHIESRYSGVNFTVGLMYEWDKLRFAGVVKTPFTLKENNDVKLFTDWIEQGDINPNSYLLSPFFETDRKWKMPSMFGFGTSYQINSLTLAADVEYRKYSETELTYRRNIANPVDQEVTTGDYSTDDWWGEEGNSPPFVPSLGWRDLTQFRIGAEYMVNTDFGGIPLRIGYRNDPKPFKAQPDPSEVYIRSDFTQIYVIGSDTFYNEQPRFVQSNQGSGKGSWINGGIFTFGTGIAWSQIKLDVTYEFAQYDDMENDVFTQIALIEVDGTNVPHVALHKLTNRNKFTKEESNKYSRLMISFTGFF